MNGKTAFLIQTLQNQLQMVAETRGEFREIVQTHDRLQNLLGNSLIDAINGPEVNFHAYTHGIFIVTSAVNVLKSMVSEAKYEEIMSLLMDDFVKLEGFINARLTELGAGNVNAN